MFFVMCDLPTVLAGPAPRELHDCLVASWKQMVVCHVESQAPPAVCYSLRAVVGFGSLVSRAASCCSDFLGGIVARGPGG